MNNSSKFDNLNNFKNYVKNYVSNIDQIDSKGNTLLHSLIKMSQESLNSSDFTNTSKYQQMADYLIKNGANLNMLNKNNESVVINPNYNNNTSNIEMSYNFASDTDFFSDTVVQSTNNINNLRGGGRKSSRRSSRSSRSNRSNRSNRRSSRTSSRKLSPNSNTLSATSDITNIVFEDISNNSEPLQEQTFTLEDEEQLTFNHNDDDDSSSEDLFKLTGGNILSSIDQIYEGGGRRSSSRRSSSRRRRTSGKSSGRRRSRKRAVSRRKRTGSRRKSRKRTGSRRKNRKRTISRRRRRRSTDNSKKSSKRRGSKKRRSSKRKVKRGLNPFMQVLAYYRLKNKGNTSLKVTDFGKNAGKIYRDAKAKVGDNATSDDVIKAAKAIIDSK